MLNQKVVFIAGCRTPFAKSGTDFANLTAYDLGRMATNGLLKKVGIDGSAIDLTIIGTVVHQIQTSNLAREIALGAAIQPKSPAFTVSLACISANMALSLAADQLILGKAKLVVAGGADSVSDIPIQVAKSLRSKLLKAKNAKSTADYIKLIAGLRPNDLKPQIPTITEFSTGLSMGQDCQKLADKLGISRNDQDAFALRSHELAYHAAQSGWLDNEITAVQTPPNFTNITNDNGVRAQLHPEKLAALPSAFAKPYGSITAGNASFLTDGAASTLLTTQHQAQTFGLKPLAVLRGYVLTAQNPATGELLLGPAYAIPQVLQQTGLQITDIDVIELHEAFAAQVLANIRCLANDTFCRDNLNLASAFGELPMDKINTWGGALAIGHPFGATGARLVSTAINRLHREDKQFALVASCAAGGHGHAMIWERI